MSEKVLVSLEFIASLVTSMGKNYVTPRDLSRVLGVSTRSAGRILRALETRATWKGTPIGPTGL